MSDKILVGRKLEYPVKDKSLGHFFFNCATKYSDHICQIDGTLDKTETFGSVKIRSTRVAIALQKRGITSNDVIAFCSPNTLDVFIPIISTFYLGAKVANLEPSLSVRHTKHLLNLISPKVIFVEESSITLIEDSLKDANFQIEIIVFGQSTTYSTFSDLVKSQPNEDDFQPVDVDVHDVALMFFSSGTTGLPKAICHSNYTFLYLTNQMFQSGIRRAVLHFTTIYWMTAMMMLTCSFKGGSYRVFCRNPSPEDIFRIIEKYKVENIFMAPILTYQLTNCEHAKNYDISSVKTLMLGGTPMASSQFIKVANLFNNASVALGYGMSEVGLVSMFDTELDKELIKKKMGSSGKPGHELKLKVVDPDTEELLGPNQKGEIRVITQSVMKGYYKADSSQVFDKDGFLKTGDVGYYDEDGCVYVVERIKEMFKYQSWHIIPSSIEAALLEHPAIKEAVVFGIPREEDGEIPAACVVLEDGFNTSKEEIDQFLDKRVADREKLRGGITFLTKLPKTPTGKVVRKEVRDFVMKSEA